VARPHALVVDDDRDLRAMMVDVLTTRGIAVVEAVDGDQALERVADAMPAVILLDMRMPGLDGWGFVREFRRRHGHAAPIVVVTAAADAVQWAAEVAAEGVLAKPFSIQALLAAVRQHLPATP
jgi:CheY-like chemotaxis protein